MKFKTMIAALAMTALAGSAFAETTVKVTFLDEAKPPVTANITPESKLVFGGTPFFEFSKCDGPTGRIAAADVKRISFEGSWMSVASPRVESTLRLRTNPVDRVLSVEGFDRETEAVLSIYTISGREAVRIAAWKGEDVDVSKLPTGVYILRINQSTLKFIKK